jgi:phospholipid/cholesterol/gamma-HCH transport system substrate-binding protein
MKLRSDRLALEVRRARIPFMLYMLLVCAALVAGWVIFKNQAVQWPWKSYYAVRVGVADAKGVVAGKQEVRIAGVKVGLITQSQLVNGSPVLTLSLDPKYAPLYRDARLRLRPITPLQDMYVAVESRGTAGAGKLTSAYILPARQTAVPVDISRVLNTFNTDTRAWLTHLLDGLGRGLSDRGAQLQAAFVQLAPFLHAAQQVTDAIASRRRETADLVHNFGALTAALAQRQGQLAGLVSSGNSTLGVLASNDVPLASMLRELPPTLGALRSSFLDLRAAEAQLDPALRALEPVARVLPSGLQALGRFGRDARPALAALRPAVRALLPLATALAPASASLQSAFANLTPQLPRLDRITARIVPCELPIQKFFQWTLSVMKIGDAYGAFPRGTLSFGADSAGGLLTQPGYTRHSLCGGAQ